MLSMHPSLHPLFRSCMRLYHKTPQTPCLMKIEGWKAGPFGSAQKLSLCSWVFWARLPSQRRPCWSFCLGKTMAPALVAGLCRRHWWTSFERHCELCRTLPLGPWGTWRPSTEPCGLCVALQSRWGLSCVSCVRNYWRPAGRRGVPWGRSGCSAACCTRPDGACSPCTARPMQRRLQWSHWRPPRREKVCSLCCCSRVLEIPLCPASLEFPSAGAFHVAQRV